jgi:hypothetical protein
VLALREESRAILHAHGAEAVLLERGQTPRLLTDHAPKFR